MQLQLGRSRGKGLQRGICQVYSPCILNPKPQCTLQQNLVAILKDDPKTPLIHFIAFSSLISPGSQWPRRPSYGKLPAWDVSPETACRVGRSKKRYAMMSGVTRSEPVGGKIPENP